MLNWADRFNICSFLDNHLYEESHHTIECVLAAGATESLSLSAGHAFPSLFDFHQQHKDWLFGQFAYDLKNELEDLRSENPDGVDVPDLYFFLPQYVLQLSKQQLSVGSLTNDH